MTPVAFRARRSDGRSAAATSSASPSGAGAAGAAAGERVPDRVDHGRARRRGEQPGDLRAAHDGVDGGQGAPGIVHARSPGAIRPGDGPRSRGAGLPRDGPGRVARQARARRQVLRHGRALGEALQHRPRPSGAPRAATADSSPRLSFRSSGPTAPVSPMRPGGGAPPPGRRKIAVPRTRSRPMARATPVRPDPRRPPRGAARPDRGRRQRRAEADRARVEPAVGGAVARTWTRSRRRSARCSSSTRPTSPSTGPALVVRARRVQGRGDDTVVKLRPVVPAELPPEMRASPSFGVEVDAMPGGFVCSGSLKADARATAVP